MWDLKSEHLIGTDYILFILALMTIFELIIELIYFPGKSKEEKKVQDKTV